MFLPTPALSSRVRLVRTTSSQALTRLLALTTGLLQLSTDTQSLVARMFTATARRTARKASGSMPKVVRYRLARLTSVSARLPAARNSFPSATIPQRASTLSTLHPTPMSTLLPTTSPDSVLAVISADWLSRTERRLFK